MPDEPPGPSAAGPAAPPAAAHSLLHEYFGQKVVVDLRSPYVCIGTLVRVDEKFMELKNADLHDFRDTDTDRENYVAASAATGVKRNRRRVLLVRDDVVAIARLDDIVDE